MIEKFKGIYAATVVPLKKNKSIDLNALSMHVKEVINTDGIKGLLLNGHAGENYILDKEEQIEIVKITRSVVPKNTIIVSGLSFECSNTGSEIALEMIDNGADSIMIFPPFSWALSYDEDLIFNHHNLIAKKIKSPIMLYQASINAGLMAYNSDTIKKLINIPEIVAIKEGSWETARYDLNRRLVKKIRVHFMQNRWFLHSYPSAFPRSCSDRFVTLRNRSGVNCCFDIVVLFVSGFF